MGFLFVSEALSSGLPIGILGPVFGIEKKNVEALEAWDVAQVLHTFEEVTTWLTTRIEMERKCARKPRMPHILGRPFSSQVISGHVLNALA